jgi:hypothetical protein
MTLWLPRASLLLVLVITLWTGMPRAELAVAEGAPFQALLNPDGSGRLLVNNGSSPAWMVCAPDLSNCRPFATGGDISTSGAPSGIVFWAGDGWLSPTWRGNVMAQGPPAVSGTLRANELVTPVPGGWQGGWATDRDTTQLSACETQAGTGCITLTDPRYPASCLGESAVLDPVFVGRYLRIANRRFAADTVTTLEAVTSPYGQEVWASSPTASIAVVGRIGPAIRPRTEKCGPPPLVRVTISARATAKVRCGLGCSASLIVRRKGQVKKITRKLRPFSLAAARNEPIPELSLPPGALADLGSGKAHIVVSVDGKRAARRTVHLR